MLKEILINKNSERKFYAKFLLLSIEIGNINALTYIN